MNLTAREPPWRSMAVVTADELKSRFGITNPRTCRRLAQAAQVTTPPSQTSVAALSLCEAVDFLTCARCVRCVLVPIVCACALLRAATSAAVRLSDADRGPANQALGHTSVGACGRQSTISAAAHAGMRRCGRVACQLQHCVPR